MVYNNFETYGLVTKICIAKYQLAIYNYFIVHFFWHKIVQNKYSIV